MRILISIIVLVLFSSCQQGKNDRNNSSRIQIDPVIHEEVLNIGKMHCEMCVASIEKGLKSVEGVEYVNVKLEDSTAFVKYNQSETNIDELRKAIEKRGYILKNNELKP